MKHTEANDSLPILSVAFVSPLRTKRLKSKESEGLSDSTNPSLANLKPVRASSKPMRRSTAHTLIEPGDRSIAHHTAVISSLNQTSFTMGKVRRQYKRKESTVSMDNTQRLPDFNWSIKPDLYAKKNPPSLYNSSRNVQSFEHHTARQEVLGRISVIGDLADEVTPGTKKDLTRPLKDVFLYCVETESKSYYHVWFKLLATFEQLFSAFTRKPAKPPIDQVEENTQVLSDVDELMKHDLDFENPKGETMAMIVKDLSKLWMSATHNVTNKDTYSTLEIIWNALVKLLNKSITTQSAKVAKAFDSIQETARLERARQKRLMDLMVKNYEDKFVRSRQNALHKENSLLKRTVDRLSRDLEETEDVVKDRDTEIYMLKQAPDTRDFRRLVLEMANYLDEVESRQGRQSLILEDIGRMINVDFTDRVERLKNALSITMTELEVVNVQTEVPVVALKQFVNRAVNTDPEPRKRHVIVPPRAEEPKSESLKPIHVESHAKFRRIEVASALASTVLKLLRTAKLHELKPLSSPVAQLETEATPVSPSKVSPVKNSTKPSPDLAISPTQPTEDCKSLEPNIIKKTFSFEQNLNSAELIRNLLPAKSEKFDAGVQTASDWIPPTLDLKVTSLSPDRPRRRVMRSSSIGYGNRSPIQLTNSLDLGALEYIPPKPLPLMIEPLKFQYPMIDASIYKLIEASMDEKAKLDMLDQEQGRPVRHMAECLLDFLYKQYGLKFLALKNLSALVEGLQKNIERPYVNFYCRLLGVFTDQPINSTLGCFLTKARTAFANCQRVVRARGFTKSLPELGGEAYFGDLIDCIPKLFSGTASLKLVGENVVRRLLLGKSLNELLPSLITTRLSKLSLEFSAFYSKLDTNRQGYSTQDSLADGIITVLDLWFPRQSLEEYCQAEFQSNVFTQSQLAGKLLVKDPYVVLQSRAAIVNKCDFLTHIVDTFADIEVQKLTDVKLVFEDLQSELINFDQFSEATSKLNLELTPTQLGEMFTKYACSEELLSSEDWVRFVKENYPGELALFPESEGAPEHDQLIEFEHSEGRLAVQFKRKNTKYFKKR